ncbi:phosphatase PAP2 family protein [Spongiibacter sp. KMU-158]|uniref:undecaprenyl-diphosphate phosphatase n=1 Tax=Spongiibacter pelagi TaxID=2760804 RepID=A0A927BZN0_9GAMM|nr:phosphatase PAP2 family protein [Spongiibacter pelagi]MBD2858538.1 phosphatase PAP2 family protein [Spongiibacter pelagi]
MRSSSQFKLSKSFSALRDLSNEMRREFQRSPVSKRPFRHLRELPRWNFTCGLILAYCLIAFALAAGIYFSQGYHGLFIDLNHGGAFLGSEFWAQLTVLGDTRVALALLLIVIYRHPQLLSATLIACLPTTLIIQLFKRTTEIARPSGFLDAELFHQTGKVLKMGSFPSGHSATAGVLFGLMILIAHTRTNKILLLSTLFLVALSRVMVGAHWPVDILVGSSIGLLCAVFAYWLSHKYRLCSAVSSQWSVVGLLIYAAISNLSSDSGYPQAHIGTVVLCFSALAIYLAHFLGFQPDRRWALGIAR